MSQNAFMLDATKHLSPIQAFAFLTLSTERYDIVHSERAILAARPRGNALVRVGAVVAQRIAASGRSWGEEWEAWRLETLALAEAKEADAVASLKAADAAAAAAQHGSAEFGEMIRLSQVASEAASALEYMRAIRASLEVDGWSTFTERWTWRLVESEIQSASDWVTNVAGWGPAEHAAEKVVHQRMLEAAIQADAIPVPPVHSGDSWFGQRQCDINSLVGLV